MRILLVRHGDAVNSEGKFHGWVDNPLTNFGRNEAKQIAPELAKFSPKQIISSPMVRATETAAIIASLLKIPVSTNRALLPLNLGAFVGKPIDKYLNKLKYYLANPKVKVPSGEAIDTWAQRFIPFFNNYFFNNDPSTIIFVTHGRNIILAEADIKEGNNLRYDNSFLLDTHRSTEHGGFAMCTPPKSFQIVTPKKVMAGQS